MDWEDVAIQTAGNLSATALRLGELYAGVWLSREQFEAQLDGYERAAKLAPRSAGVAPLGVLLLIGLGVLLVARS